MKHRQIATLPLIFLATLASATLLPAGQEWMETTYFAPDYKPDLKVPAPEASWKVYIKKKILMSKEAEGVEFLEGTEQGTKIWAVGNLVVSILKNGETSIFPKTSGEARQWDGGAADLAWIKKLEPVRTEKRNGQDLSIYESGNGFKRAWIVADAKRPLAMVEGKFVTIYEENENPGEIRPPEAVVKALEERKRGEKKLGEIGAMPQ